MSAACVHSCQGPSQDTSSRHPASGLTISRQLQMAPIALASQLLCLPAAVNMTAF